MTADYSALRIRPFFDVVCQASQDTAVGSKGTKRKGLSSNDKRVVRGCPVVANTAGAAHSIMESTTFNGGGVVMTGIGRIDRGPDRRPTCARLRA